MSDDTMTHGELESKLADYLEGALGTRDRAAVEAHLASCARCQALVAALDERPRAAAELPALSPSRDLWSGIEARIQPRVLPLASRAPRWWTDRRTVAQLAVAASMLVAVTIALTVVIMGRIPRTVAKNTPAPTVVSPTGTPAVPVTNQEKLIVSYDEEIAALDSAVDQRQGQGKLDTATVRIIKKNLLVIDSAIAESRRALAADPHNRFLNDQLARVLGQKVGLLRTAALLPTRT